MGDNLLIIREEDAREWIYLKVNHVKINVNKVIYAEKSVTETYNPDVREKTETENKLRMSG